MQAETRPDSKWLWLIPAAKFLLHIVTATGYGYFRDELYYIACAQHLSFGYVDQPPLSIFLLWIQRMLLGDSLHALRFLPAVAGAATVYLAGRIAKEFGGKTSAQALAMVATMFAPDFLSTNHYYSMNSFDVLLWALCTWQLLRCLRIEQRKEWILLGIFLGLGLMNKISVLWLGAGIFAGLLLSPYRRTLIKSGPWIAGIIAAIFFLPYVVWQFQNDFATLEFMKNATTEKMAGQAAIDFFKDQILNLNPISAPLWMIGLLYSFFSRNDRRLKLAGFIYVVTAAILLLSPAARSGYLAPAYPSLFAIGSLAIERWLAQRPFVIAIYALLIAAFGFMILPFAIPVLPVEKYIAYAKKMGVAPSTEEKKEVSELPQFYADMFGWREMTQQVADVFNKLPPEERKNARIFGLNYGVAAAINFYGKAFSLPQAISTHNNYWIWGPGDYNGEVLLMLGGSKERKQQLFENVQEAGRIHCEYCMPYENNKIIYICRHLKFPVAQVWKDWKHYD